MNNPGLTVGEVLRLIQAELQKSQYNVAKQPFHAHTGLDSTQIDFRNIAHSFLTTATQTQGTTPVLVFNNLNSPIGATITGAFIISNDTTAGNISIYNTVGGSQRTVATLVKGTVAGAMIGATALANSTQATLITVKSDSTGNSTVFLTFAT